MNDENTIPEEELTDTSAPASAETPADPEPLDPFKSVEEAKQEPGDEAEVIEMPEPEPAQTQLLRLRADFDNYRKRTEREKGEWTLRANERLIESILPALDTFDMGIADAIQNDAKPEIIEGFRMVQTMLLDSLQRSGLRAVDAIGLAFDPNQHEAINRMASDEVEADHVLFQSRRGYLLGEKLLRPAQVVVSTGSEGAAEEASDAVNEADAGDDQQGT